MPGFLFSRRAPRTFGQNPSNRTPVTRTNLTNTTVATAKNEPPKPTIATVSTAPPIASFAGMTVEEASDDQHHRELIEADENWAYWDEIEETDGECAMGMGIINRLDSHTRGEAYPLIEHVLPEEEEIHDTRPLPIGVKKNPDCLKVDTDQPLTPDETASLDMVTSRQYIQFWGDGVHLMAMLDTGAACNFMPRAIYQRFFSHLPLHKGKEMPTLRGLLDFEDQPMDGVVRLQFIFCGECVEAAFPVGNAPDCGVVIVGQALMDKLMLSVGYDSRRNRVCRMGFNARIVPSYHRKGDKFILVQRNHRANASVSQIYCKKKSTCVVRVPIKKEQYPEGTTFVIEPERSKSGLEVQGQVVEVRDGRIPLTIHNLTKNTLKVDPSEFHLVTYEPKQVIPLTDDPVEAITEDPEILAFDQAERAKAAQGEMMDAEAEPTESPFLPYDGKHGAERIRQYVKEMQASGVKPPEYPGVDFDSMGYTPEQILWIKYGLAEGASVFSETKEDLGLMADTEHHIDVQGNRPIAQPVRPIPLAKKNVITEEIAKMLRAGVIRPSKSPWSSPIVLVRKKDDTWRFCVDYRKVNDITKKDRFPSTAN